MKKLKKLRKVKKRPGIKKQCIFGRWGKVRGYFGKNFNDSVMNMSEVTQDSGRVVVKGEIIRTEARE